MKEGLTWEILLVAYPGMMVLFLIVPSHPVKVSRGSPLNLLGGNPCRRGLVT